MASSSTLSILSPSITSGLASNKSLNEKRSVSLTSFASISSTSLSGRRRSLQMQRKWVPATRAMAKELYFNKDGSATKKMQVSLLECV